MCSGAYFGLFIGYLNLIIYSAKFIVFSILLANANLLEIVADGDGEDVDIVRISSCICLICSIIMTILSIFLVQAIRKRRHSYIKTWLIIGSICLIVSIVMCFFDFFVGKKEIGKFFGSLFKVALQCLVYYPICIVYREIHEENTKTIPTSDIAYKG